MSHAGREIGNKGRRARWLALAALFAVFIAVQCFRLPMAPWDVGGSWRQSDTYSMALNYVQYGMDPLRPQLNYDGLSGNYAQLELQIVPFLSAVLFRLLGTTSWVIPRLLSLLFFLGSAWYLYRLMGQFTGFAPTFMGTAIYLFLPLSVQMAAAIQPESCALFFYCGGVYYLKRFHDTGRGGFALAAGGMTALAILEKTPAAFVGLLFLYVFFSRWGRSAFRRPVFYATGAVALLPFLLFTLYTSAHSTFKFVDGIASKHILSPGKLLSLFTREGVAFFLRSGRECFGWGAVALALVGLTLCLGRERRFYLVWAGAFALECATIVAIIRFDYYLVFVLPICAALVSVAAEELGKCKKQAAVTACAAVLVLTCASSVRRWQLVTPPDPSVDRAGAFIAQHTEPDDGLAVAALNPAYLNAANRRGYRANIAYYDFIPTGPAAETDWFIDQGVSKFVVVDGAVYNDPDGAYLAYLEANFPICARCDYCVIYDLEAEA